MAYKPPRPRPHLPLQLLPLQSQIPLNQVQHSPHQRKAIQLYPPIPAPVPVRTQACSSDPVLQLQGPQIEV